jgi:hypothetical protein
MRLSMHSESHLARRIQVRTRQAKSHRPGLNRPARNPFPIDPQTCVGHDKGTKRGTISTTPVGLFISAKPFTPDRSGHAVSTRRYILTRSIVERISYRPTVCPQLLA